jgi:hypothetical protein
MNYMFGKVRPGSHACRLKTLQNVDDDYELHQGISRINDWPEDAYFQMNENFPDYIKLEDFIFNTNNVLVISEKFREFMENENLKNNEILPIAIVNHKGRIVIEKYFILHQLTLQDCIDLDESVVRLNEIDPESFQSVRKLVIDEDKVDPDVSIFRMARYPSLAIFRKDLAQRIQQEGFTGIVFGEISEWEGK